MKISTSDRLSKLNIGKCDSCKKKAKRTYTETYQMNLCTSCYNKLILIINDMQPRMGRY